MTQSALDLSGRTAVVSGAGNGLGRASALALGRAGAHVVCVDLDAEAAAATAAELTQASSAAIDVTDRSAVSTVVARAVADTGRLDVLCNIAGVPGDLASVLELDLASFDRIFAVHFKGALFGCQAALEHMKDHGGGSIINMASGAIDLAIPGTASYAVSKAAIVMLTKTLAVEGGPFGVRANAVAPGFVPTALSMVRHSSDEATRQAYLDAWSARAPMQRVGVPEDIAQQVLYLASDAASFVTGQVLRANGGATMPW
jgi:NAD(P)-dependent dehydrogenase (short-subunit alcohol dehydrogenase family)